MKYQAVSKKNIGARICMARSMSVCRAWSPFPIKRNQSSLEKWLTLGLRRGRYKMSLEHSVMPESKKVLKKNDEYMSQGHRKGLPPGKWETI